MPNDSMVKDAARQATAVMEQQNNRQRTQDRSASVDQTMAGKQAEVRDCAGAAVEKIGNRAEDVQDTLREANAGPNVQEAAGQWKKDLENSVKSAADDVNKLIAAVFSESSERHPDQQQLQHLDEATRSVRELGDFLEDQSAQVRSLVEKSLDAGSDDDALLDIFQKAQQDRERQCDDVQSSMKNRDKPEDLDQSKSEDPIRRMVDEVEADGREKRKDQLRGESRKIALERFRTDMESGIHSAQTEALIDEIGIEKAVALTEEKIKMNEAGVQVNHISELETAPELAKHPENLELLGTKGHREGFHGNDFQKERDGQPADPNYDKHVGFHVDEPLEEHPPQDEVDRAIENAADHAPYEAEDAMIEAIDRQREEELSEEFDARQRQLDAEREAQRQEDESRDRETRAQETADERARTQAQDRQRDEDRRRQQDEERRRDEQRRRQQEEERRRREEQDRS